jgi:diguanylate cyclase (GGDEF)-like protein
MPDLGAEQAHELKSLFLRELSAGYVAARAAHDALRQGGAEKAHLETLRRFFHKLAGAAQSVNFAVLGKLSGACETAAEAMIAGKFAWGRYAQQLLGDGLAGVSAVLEQEGQFDPSPPLPPMEAAPEPLGGEVEVVVVDDDPAAAQAACDALRKAGVEASSCGELLAAIQLDAERHQGGRAGPGAKILVRASQIRELTIRDGLTNCYTTPYLKSRLEQEIARARRYKSRLALGMLDVDNFKRINDAYGRAAGDAVISKIASLVTSSLRASDVVARYAGDEFAFLLIEASLQDCTTVCNRLRETIMRTPFELPETLGGGLRLSTTISIGLGEFKADDTAHDFLLRVDGALFEAKNSGRNRVWVAP